MVFCENLASMENFGKFCFIVLGVLITSIYGGFVFSKLWLWVMVEHFSFKELTIYQCIGVMILIGSFVKTSQKNEEDKTKSGWEKLVLAVLESLVKYSLYLGVGYAYYLLR